MPSSILLWIVLVAVLAGLGAACGTPDQEPKEFPFTPVAFEPNPDQEKCPWPRCGRFVATAPNGTRYFADQVGMLVEVDHVADIRHWAEGFGFEFTVLNAGDKNRHALIVLGVPPGSVFSVIAEAETLDGVVAAEPNELTPLIQTGGGA